jgi:hypothetical protein
MERITHYADLSIRRGCGFGFLAIATAMVGCSSEIVLAVKLGALGVTLMGVILVLKAMRAPSRRYRDTEVWYMMDQRHDLPESRAQQVFGSVLKERYLWHATLAGFTAAFLWLLTFALQYGGRGMLQA